MRALLVEAERVHARLRPDYFRERPAGQGGPVTRAGLAVRPTHGDGRTLEILVAEVAGEIVGYASIQLVDTPRDPAVIPARRAHVETVVVAQAHRRHGIGTALMEAAAEWGQARGAVELILTVWSNNRAADALYRRGGYEPLARILRRRLPR